MAVSLGEQFDRRPASLDPRSANEDTGVRLRAESIDTQIDFGGFVLTAEGIAPHRDIDETERRLIETGDLACGDDHPHARSPQRHSAPNALHDRRSESGTFEQ